MSREVALNCRRLRHEVRRLWTPDMHRALRSLRRRGGDLEAIFETRSRHPPLVVVFPPDYPFRCMRLCVEVWRVPHSLWVARALRRRPAAVRDSVADALRRPVRVDLKRWAYEGVRRHEGEEAAAEAARRYTRRLPPHLWTPAMDLARHCWEEVTRMLERAHPAGCSCPAAAQLPPPEKRTPPAGSAPIPPCFFG